MAIFFLPLIAALIFAVLSTPVVIRIANWLRFVDAPDGNRKQQGSATALGGGVVLFVSVIATMWLVNPFMNFGSMKVDPLPLKFLLPAATIILVAGIIDDKFGIRGSHKLLLQILASLVGAFCLGFDRLDILGFGFELGSLKILAAAFWMLCCINAFNLIDGADGVAATLGSAISFSLGIIAIVNGKPEAAFLPLALAGALGGFLAFNAPPAKIYLGDSGSMLVGLMVGIVAMHASVKSQATFAIGAPLALLAIPFADTGFAIFRRKLTGRSIYDTDRGHIHHCLLSYGASPSQLVAIVAVVSAGVSVVTVASIVFEFDLLLPTLFFGLLYLLARFRIFGHGEFQLLMSRLWPFSSGTSGKDQNSVGIHLQGNRNWDSPWGRIVKFCESSDVRAAQFSLNIPRLHESYYGRWGSNRAFSNRSYYKIALPLVLDGESVGYVEMCGLKQDASNIHSPLDGFATNAVSLVQDIQDQVTSICDFETDVATMPPLVPNGKEVVPHLE